MSTIDEKAVPIDAKGVDVHTMVEGGEYDEVDRAHAAKEAEINKHIDQKLMEKPEAFPKAIYFIIPNEAGERFCFYGINPLLKPLLNLMVGFPLHRAESFVHVFKSVTYFFPLVGAAISDSFLDKFKTIVSLSSVYLIGLVLLSVFSRPGFIGDAGSIPAWGPLLGLFLVALGTGGIKPCVSAHGGDQFLPNQKLNLNKFYNYFYMAINIGAVTAGFITPPIQKKSCFGGPEDCYSWSFALCTMFFAAALSIFVIGKRVYRVVPPVGNFVPFLLGKAAVVHIKNLFTHGFDQSKARAASSAAVGEPLVVELFDLLKVLVAIMPAPFFWMAFDQNSSSWQSLTDQMASNNWMDSEMTNAVLNPLFICILAPIFANWVYPAIDKRWKFGLLRRMVVGMILCGLAFIVTGLIQKRVTENCVDTEFTKPDGKTKYTMCMDYSTHTGIFIIPYLIMTTGEVLFSISGLNFTYQEVGKRTKSSCAALWLLGTALGNVFASALFESPVGTDWAREHFFYFVGVLCFVAALVQAVLNRFYVYKENRVGSQ
ncbi:hypothetical protein HK104_008196 [Borealophlyctis nickersoniae]|nr:hypothetical protein HK104_008196 [Borealophlyctis nickersoniae]